jgi:hypothetical protein
MSAAVSFADIEIALHEILTGVAIRADPKMQ